MEGKMLSERALKMKPSAVMSLGARAQEKKAQGIDVISLALGEPTWDTPQSICSAGLKLYKMATQSTPLPAEAKN